MSYKVKVITWWESLSNREHWMLIAAVGVSVILVWYYLIYTKLEYQKKHLADTLKQAQLDLQWAHNHSADFKKMMAESARYSNHSSNLSILTVIDRSAKSNGIRPSIQSISPVSNNTAVRVSHKEVDFNQWIKWVQKLELKESVKVQDVSIQKADSGKVTIRVTFIRN